MINKFSPVKSIPMVAFLAFVAANSARADFGPEKKVGWNLNLGAGIMYQPAFTGSDEYQTLIIPYVKLEYADRFFAAPFEGTGYNFINTDSWRAGPLLKFDFGRNEDGSNPFLISGKETKALAGMGDVDFTPELGGFLEYNLGPLSYSLEILQGIGGHEGLVAETSLNLMIPAGPVMMMVGPRITFGDATYNNAFFGINPTQSAKTGLAEYSASSGMVSYGLNMFAMTPISDSVSLVFMATYDQLGSEATESPLIKERGEERVFEGRLIISYEF
jgi:MipA family protein